MPRLRVIAIFTLTFVTALMILEVVLRSWLVTPRYKIVDPELGLLNRGNVRVVWSDEGWGVNQINSLGLLGPELREPRSPLRVVVLGNSYTEALQVFRDQSFAGISESLIPGSEFINAAHSDWSMAEELALLRRLSPLIDPDVVVAQFSAKPPFGSASAHLRLDENGAWQLMPAAADRSITRRIKNQTDAFARHSALLTMLLRKGSDMVRREGTRLSARFDRAPRASSRPRDAAVADLDREAEATRWILQQMAAEAEKVITLVIPSIEYRKDECLEPLNARARRAMIHRISRMEGVPVVDPTQAFCKRYLETHQPLHGFHNVLMGSGHLNSEGHRIMGRQLAAEIKALPE